MTGKSRHRKGKYSYHGKRKKDNTSQPAAVVQQLTATQPDESTSHLAASVPSASMPNPRVKPTAGQYPYIAKELWTISILAAIVIIILVTLALVLP